jgi:DNA-binding MarR family transcriptional regulator
LADLLEIEPITLGRIVDRLQILGLIERRPNSSDRRVWLLHLTATARPKLSQLGSAGCVLRIASFQDWIRPRRMIDASRAGDRERPFDSLDPAASVGSRPREVGLTLRPLIAGGEDRV